MAHNDDQEDFDNELHNEIISSLIITEYQKYRSHLIGSLRQFGIKPPHDTELREAAELYFDARVEQEIPEIDMSSIYYPEYYADIDTNAAEQKIYTLAQGPFTAKRVIERAEEYLELLLEWKRGKGL